MLLIVSRTRSTHANGKPTILVWTICSTADVRDSITVLKPQIFHVVGCNPLSLLKRFSSWRYTKEKIYAII